MSAQGHYETVHTFSGDRGRPVAGLVEGPDSRLYGTTITGGFFGKGSVFATDAAGYVTTIHEFNGAAPRGRLLLASDGNFYGTTSEGALGYGTIFRLTPDGTLTTLVTFTGANGSFPQAGLLEASDRDFYGTTLTGGPGGLGLGTVFRLAADGSGLTTIVSFDGDNGALPYGPLMQAADGSFYGTTEQGGADGQGTVFQISGGTLTIRVSFNGANGASPRDGVIEASDGTFYGATLRGGGPADSGTVFQLTPAGVLSTLITFSGGDDGKSPRGGLRELSDGLLYGTTQGGGADGFGTLFQFDMTSPAPITPITLHSFAGTDGAGPASGVIQTVDGTAYGATENGGSGGYGTIFRLTPDLAVSTVTAFTGAIGADPTGRLVKAGDGNFYGTTISGGTSGYGTVFRLTPAGVVTTLASFDWDNGAFPSGGLVQASDGNLYGTTEGGGATGEGTVFSLTLEGTLTTLASFDFFVSGVTPLGGLIEARDGNLYGTTLFGPNGAPGSVFRLMPMSAVSLTTQVAFDGSNGAFPTAGVMQGADDALYGTTEEGGVDGLGTVFRLPIDGTLETLVSFDNVMFPGYLPAAGLLQASDGNIYGTTSFGGDTDNGTVFRLTPGTPFGLETVASFDGINGSYPNQQGLIEAADGYLYGTATDGGAAGFGVVYRLEGGAIVPIHTFDGAMGANPDTTVIEDSAGALYGTAAGPQGGVIYRILFNRFALQVAPAKAPSGGVTTLSATLTNLDAPVVGTEIAFKIKGVAVGAATTGADGVATLANVTVTGLAVGTHTGAVMASFVGGGTLVEAVADLTIVDVTPPLLQVPGNLMVNATSPGGTTVTYVVTATDDSGPPVTISCSPTSGSVFPIGTTEVTCKATDSSGNTSEGRFKVTVLGAVEQIVALIERLKGMPLSSTLKAQLTKFLQAALTDPRNVAYSCDLLRYFIAYVKLYAGKWIPLDLAAQLIADATRIRAVLGCG